MQILVFSRLRTVRTGWSLRLLFLLGPDLLFLLAFTLVLVVLVALFGYRSSLGRLVLSVSLPLAILGVLLVMAFAVRARGILTGDWQQRRLFLRHSLTTVRDWLPLTLLLFVYENFHDLTYVIRPEIVDGTLRRIDEMLFSVHPALLLQRITRPWLTEYMSFAYAPCFFYPMTILAILYARNELVKFREFGLALSLCFYGGLLGYMLVPAIGPRYTMQFTVPLTGYWLTDRAADAWNAVEAIKRDCFPSLHTAMTTIALIYLWRLRRSWRYGTLLLAAWVPLIVSLWFSTIYLRYHYVVDVLAGWTLAYACCRMAPVLTRWYYTRKLVGRLVVEVDDLAAHGPPAGHRVAPDPGTALATSRRYDYIH